MVTANLKKATSRFKATRWGSKGGYDIETATGEVRKLVSVTTYLSVIDKPLLRNWIARENREEVIRVATDLYTTVAPNPPMSRTGFAATLRQWLGKTRADQKKFKRAGEIGTALHKHIEWTIRKELGQEVGPQPELPPEGQTAFSKWIEWRDTVDLKPIHIEQVVYSLEFGYAGTLDLYAEVEGQLAVVDWKSGKAIYPEAYLQNAAYCCALEEMEHGKPVVGYIILLPKTEGQDFDFAKIEKQETLENFSVFLSAMRMWEFVCKNGKP